jgi:ubiquinol-cytochrome c reductase cytochrome c subunit
VRLALAVALVAAVVPAVAGAQPPPFLGSKQGEALYNANCLGCHGPRGEGVSTADRTRGALDLAGAGPSLRDVGALAADFYLRTGYMPLGDPAEQPTRRASPFDSRQLDALIGYVAALGNGPPVPRPHPERGSVSVGLRLFTQSCAGCHQVVAAGGYVTGARVPPLDRATPTQIAEAVRLGPYLMPRFGTSQISPRKLDAITAYVVSTQNPDDAGGWGIGHLGPVPEGMVAWLIGLASLLVVARLAGEREP